jgi:uncharacterized membrane protein
MLVPEALVNLFQPWNDFYSHSKAAETVVQFLHIGGLVMAGGLAIAAADLSHYSRELASVHRWVITGLGVVVVSVLALVTSDIESFFGSWIFWTKMGLVVLLLLNGLRMTRIEAELRRDASEASPQWPRLRRTAITSLALWFVITAFGVSLVNLV